MHLITIDPGYEGAICIQTNTRYYIYPMPVKRENKKYKIDYFFIIGILKKYKNKNYICYIESQYLNSKTIEHCGILKGILMTLNFELYEIHPSTWSSKLKKISIKSKIPKNTTYLKKLKDNKYRNLLICKTLFPNVNLSNIYWSNKYNLHIKRKTEYSDGIADSLLINYYVNNFIYSI